MHGAAFGGAKIWNYEILAASGELTFALETMIFYSYTPNTPPVLVSHPLYTKKLTLLIWPVIRLL